jgi:ornithine carbamoyltransferase
LSKKYSTDFPLVAINANSPDMSPGDSFEEMQQYARSKGYTFPYLVDETQEVARTYGATNTPHVFVLTRNQGVLKVAYIGDGNNVAHSLIYGAVRFGVHLAVASPAGYGPDPEVVQWAEENASSSGCRLEIIQDPVAAATDADAIYTDVWASMGVESEAAKRRQIFRAYQSVYSCSTPNPIMFMHCLPHTVMKYRIRSIPRTLWFSIENHLHAQKPFCWL